MHVNLVYFRPDGERKDIPLHGSEILMGRAEDCNLRIPLAAVSRQHCRVIIGDDEVLIEDLGSANGTFVNNRKVSRKELRAGDNLQVGQASFIVQIDGKPKKVRNPFEGVAAAEAEQVPDNDLIANPGAEEEVVEVAEASGDSVEAVEAAPGDEASVEEVVADEASGEMMEEPAVAESGDGSEEVIEVEEASPSEDAVEAVAPESVAEPGGEGEVILEEEGSVIDQSDDNAVAIDLENVEVQNAGSESSSVEDILLELEAAEEEEAKKKR
jgi:pSer/pThr/pTyr-binding forkhead associated (FHA) protein